MTTRSFIDRSETKLLTFHGNKEDDFQLWELRVKAVFRKKDIAEALVNKSMDKKIRERALRFFVSVHRYNPLGASQNCETAIGAWGKLQFRYAGKPMINRLTALKNRLSTKLKGN